MAGPGPLSVAQALDEGYGVVCQFLVVGRRFGFEFGGFVLFQFPHERSLLSYNQFLDFFQSVIYDRHHKSAQTCVTTERLQVFMPRKSMCAFL